MMNHSPAIGSIALCAPEQNTKCNKWEQYFQSAIDYDHPKFRCVSQFQWNYAVCLCFFEWKKDENLCEKKPRYFFSKFQCYKLYGNRILCSSLERNFFFSVFQLKEISKIIFANKSFALKVWITTFFFSLALAERFSYGVFRFLARG